MNMKFKIIVLACFLIMTQVTVSYAEDWQFQGRYLVKEGMAKDPTTGLIWMRCSFGQNWDGSTCQGEAAKITWKQAMAIPQHFEYADYNDWRVPTREELKSLVDCGQASLEQTSLEDGQSGCSGDHHARPTIATKAFPNTPEEWFWSSSAVAHTDYYAWYVAFGWGHDSWTRIDNSKVVVRLVRSGQ